MNSHNAKRIERKYGDTETLRWIGASLFEKRQLIMIEGKPGIVYEIAAVLGIDNVELIGTHSYNVSKD